MKRLSLLFALSLFLTGCVEESLVAPAGSPVSGGIRFTASIAPQDFYGAGRHAETRSPSDDMRRVKDGFYDLRLDGRDDILLSVSTVDGMFGKPSSVSGPVRRNMMTRGALLHELEQEPIYIMETGTRADGTSVQGEPYEVYTEDGTTWGGKFTGTVDSRAALVSDVIHAVYPARMGIEFGSEGETMEYTTPSEAKNQCDMLYAEREITLSHESVDSLHLTFDHILTAVRFKIGSEQLPVSVVKSITISGIATHGTFDCMTRRWAVDPTSVGAVSCDLDYNVTGKVNIIMNSGENTFMLIPQKLPENARLTIAYEDYTEGEDLGMAGQREITASLATVSTPAWEPGQSITYTLTNESQSEYILEVDPLDDFGPEGGNQTVNVLSYRHVEGVRTPMQWMVQNYSSDGGATWMNGGSANVPKGLSISPTEGTDTTTINVTLNSATTTIGSHRDFLRYKSPLGNDGDGFDLSRHDYLNNPCSCTTANCYVVDAPGRYRFPLVYGNGVVDGLVNDSSYNESAWSAADKGLIGYSDYRGNPITAPWIVDNGIKLSRAVLLWEDVNGLIKPGSINLVGKEGDKDAGNAIAAEFEIPAETIDQGNAVIAVLDGGGNIVWSWHIWVTDEKANLAEPVEVQNKYGETVGFMPLTLGWCSTANGCGIIGREAAVRITMPVHPSSRASFRIRQTSTIPTDCGGNLQGNAPYYNWGRKDPFPGAFSTADRGINDVNMECQPKAFHQTEGGSLGMHAEMNVVYGNNYLKLLAAGALNAFNGFLTGVMIGQICNGLSPASTTVTEASFDEKVQVAEILYENGAEEAATIAEAVAQYPVLAPFAREGVSSSLIIQKVGEDFAVLGNVYTYEGVAFGYTVFTRVEDGVLCTFYFSAPYLAAMASTRSFVSLGPFSACLIGDAVGNIYGNNAGFFEILANSNFWSGGTEWCQEMKDHGVSLSDGILHPNILYRDAISWTQKKYTYLWNASTNLGADDRDTKVVKTVYDPCPAGYCVPSARDFSNIIDNTTFFGLYGSTSVKDVDGEKSLSFPGLGMRNFWSGAEPGLEATNNINEQIMLVGDQGLYWTASPAINTGEEYEVGAYAINFRGAPTVDKTDNNGHVQYNPRVMNDLKLQQSYALPVRPVRERR